MLMRMATWMILLPASKLAASTTSAMREISRTAKLEKISTDLRKL
jgi:hypothetical protein